MRGTISRRTTLSEFAAIVAGGLEQRGIRTLLVGGSVVSIYTRNVYESFDLDFVTEAPRGPLHTAMIALGFARTGGRHYIHPNSAYYVEFLDGPAGIGNLWIDTHATRKTKYGTLNLYDPTQCTMDRLAAWYHWNDAQGLEQAILVASRKAVRLEDIRRWSVGEGHLDRFETFKQRLSATQAGRREK